MNSKNIKKHLNAKLKDWLDSIDDSDIKSIIRNNVIITGGALVSLLTGEPVNDYDVYFRTKDACAKVAEYYVKKWNESHPEGKQAYVEIKDGVEGNPERITVFIQSSGVVEETSEENPYFDFEDEEVELEEPVENPEEPTEKKPKYRPVFITSNAITLANKIQIVTRFYGEVEEIHKNYDFAHCTCSWTSWNNEVQLPTKALECIINKELYYVGSKYPLCSIIRTRKYLGRGYTIDAGQYLKMALQLNELNLKNIETLKDQLTGVDSAYFNMLIEALEKTETDEAGNLKVDNNYVIEIINRMF